MLVSIPGWAATLLAGLFSCLALFYVHRLNARRTATIIFRAAFTPALARLEAARRHGSTHNTPDVDGFLLLHFEVMAAAIHNFGPFVTSKNAEAYQHAWQSYCQLTYDKGTSAVFMASVINEKDP